MKLASEFKDDFLQRVFAVLLTDSAHGFEKIPSFIGKSMQILRFQSLLLGNIFS